jgi:hypothetical protein
MKSKSVEVTDAVINVEGAPVVVEAAVATTQERHSARAMLRTGFQMLVALAVLWPIVIGTLDLPDWAWVGTATLVAAGITRLMALPEVEQFLRRFAPFLSAAPKPPSSS